MDAVFADFATAHNTTNGYLLATCISPEPPQTDPARLYNFQRSTNAFSVQTDLRYKLQYNPDLRLDKREAAAWLDVFTAYYSIVEKLLAAEELQNAGRNNEADWVNVYDGWKAVVNALHKGYSGGWFEAWTIPCLYLAGKYLRIFAIKADEKSASQRDSGLAFGGLQEEDAFDVSSRNEKLEDAARQINRLFSLCISDRYVATLLLNLTVHDLPFSMTEAKVSLLSNPIEDSRKWALYYIATLLFKTYFRLNSISLSKNILRSLKAAGKDMPPLSAFPKSHQVTFKYYNGVIAFLDEDYAAAEGFLSEAYAMCDPRAEKNLALILTYLIPTRMLTTHRLPTSRILQQSSALDRLFTPLCSAIKRADLRAFNFALEQGEDEFVKRRIYLTLERGRDIILRNLFRKVFVAGGFEVPKEGEAAVRRTRVPLKEFAAALQMAGAEVGDGNGEGGVDGDEVECLIANCIYKASHVSLSSLPREYLSLNDASLYWERRCLAWQAAVRHIHLLQFSTHTSALADNTPQNFMKGYIARDRGLVVLSKTGAFPGTGV